MINDGPKAENVLETEPKGESKKNKKNGMQYKYLVCTVKTFFGEQYKYFCGQYNFFCTNTNFLACCTKFCFAV